MITVYCDDSSHAERRWEIAAFTQTGFGGWSAIASAERQLSMSNGLEVFLADADRYLPQDATGTAVRMRHRLRCRICGWNRVYRGETLKPVFDKLAECGVDTISVKAIAALQ
ncbi:hypothetical protein [Mycolicibacterium pyrenivorans]|uniref:hypothetical protein n=1 Tax=Mycolicibacterium pyrenivorans TaxID=187102 RepID=UPI0021F3406F|nr:hypothetical protein [Mycolicibacterium pyrenivorans]MCV7150524.1 hypothetical protein [Mycolicibacterium pyrenivorans]